MSNYEGSAHLLSMPSQAPTKDPGTIVSVSNCGWFDEISRLSFGDFHPSVTSRKLQTRLNIVALVDPNLERCAAVLASKRATFVEQAYRNTIAVKTIEELVEKMTPEMKPK